MIDLARDMRVLLKPMDASGCGSYRLRYPMAVLAAAGHHVTLAAGSLPAAGEGLSVVVLQRPTDAEVAGVTIGQLQSRGFAVVVEVDDDLSALHPEHAVYRRLHPRYSPDDNHRHLEAACAQADLVTVSTPALAQRYAPHGRWMVLPNCVRALDVAAAPVAEGERSVTWAGQVASHPQDFDVAVRGVRALADRGWTFRAYDPAAIRLTGLAGAGRLPPAELLAWVPLEGYVRHLSVHGLGLVPLRDSPFNEAKSWLKGLEYAAAGVPFVASSTAAYQELAGLGAGLLAGSPNDWRRQLRRLDESPAMRHDLAVRGLQVAAALTYERHAGAWWAAWEQALVNYRGRTLSAQAQQWVGRAVAGVTL